MSEHRSQVRPKDPKTGRLFRVVDLAENLSAPPRAVRRAKLDNVALVPASLLPFKTHYQALANRLPAGEVLIVLPTSTTATKETLQKVAASYRAKGQQVTVVSSEKFH